MSVSRVTHRHGSLPSSVAAETLLEHQSERHQREEGSPRRAERGGGGEHPTKVRREDQVPGLVVRAYIRPRLQNDDFYSSTTELGRSQERSVNQYRLSRENQEIGLVHSSGEGTASLTQDLDVT